MDAAMKQLMEECEEILLEVQILGEDFPKIKAMYDNVVGLTKKLDKSAEEYMATIASKARKVEETIERQEKLSTQLQAGMEEFNKNLTTVKQFISTFEELKSENERLSKENIENNRKIEELLKQLNSKIINPPANDIYKSKIDKLEKEIEELKKSIKNSNPLGSTGTIKKKSLSEIKAELGVPSTAKCMTLDEEPNCSKHKPYGVLIDGKYIEADAWTVLMEAFATYCFKRYDKKDTVADIVDEEYDDGYGHLFFINGTAVAGYNYLPTYKISIYKPGADGTVRMMQALCEYYNLDGSEIRLFYYKK